MKKANSRSSDMESKANDLILQDDMQIVAINEIKEPKNIVVFDNLGDAINSSGLSDRDTLMTKGYYQKGDNGGAFYEVVDNEGKTNVIRNTESSFMVDDVEIAFSKENGVITLNGTCSKSTVINTKIEPFERQPVKGSTTYIMSSTYVGGSISYEEAISNRGQIIFIGIATSKTNSKVITSSNWVVATNSNYATNITNKPTTTVACEDLILNKLQIMLSPGTVFNNYQLKLKLEEGTTATEWDSGAVTQNGVTTFETLDSKMLRLLDYEEINLKQLGCKQSNKYDCKEKMLAYIEECQRKNKQVKIYIPGGEWYFSETRIYGDNIYIAGSGAYKSPTRIKALNENQRYIWKIGGTVEPESTSEPIALTHGYNIKNLSFCTEKNSNGDLIKVTTALYIDYCTYSTFADLSFSDLFGTGLTIRSSWELYFGVLNFRNISDLFSPCLNLEKTKSVFGVKAANISACEFQSLMFEGCEGDLIFSHPQGNFTHSHIGNINIELSWNTTPGYGTTQINDRNISTIDRDVPNMWNMGVYNGFARFITIGTINITALVTQYIKLAEEEEYDYACNRAVFMYREHKDATTSYYRRQEIAVGSIILNGGYPQLYYSNIVGDTEIKLSNFIPVNACTRIRGGSAYGNGIQILSDVQRDNNNINFVANLDNASTTYDSDSFHIRKMVGVAKAGYPFHFFFNPSDGKIKCVFRVKIPAGITKIITLYRNENQNDNRYNISKSVTGTGKWEHVAFYLNWKTTPIEEEAGNVFLRVTGTDTENEALFDYYYFEEPDKESTLASLNRIDTAYIKGNGDGYIDTGEQINVSSSYKFEMKCAFASPTAMQYLFGIDALFSLYTDNSKKIKYRYNSQVLTDESGINIEEPHTYLIDNNKLYVDDKLILTAPEERLTGSSARKLYLFALSTQANANMKPSSVDMYYCKMWRDGALIHDYIPTRRNNIACLYDLTKGDYLYPRNWNTDYPRFKYFSN